MYVIPPLTITDAMLTSSTIVETAPTAWNSGTTYALNDSASIAGANGLMTVYKSLQAGNLNHLTSDPAWWVNIGTTYGVYAGGTTYAISDRVIDATNHLVYESLAGSNTGNALTNTTWWLEIGPTNKWAMFDLLRDTQSTVPTSMTFTFAPGQRVDSLALLGLSANDVSISITSSSVTVYSYSTSLDERHVNNWYDYFFLPFHTKESLLLLDIPPYSNCIITITLSGLASISLGACVVGIKEYLGAIQYSAESDSLNFSTVTRDFAGGTNVMVQRRNVPKTIQNCFVDKSRINRIRSIKDSIAGSPAVWAGLDDNSSDYFEALLILGFYKRFSFNLAYPDYAIISLELEEI